MRALGILCVAWLVTANTVVAAETDEVLTQVMARDAEIADAHGRGDLATHRAGLSERYVYIDVSGARVTADKLETRRQNDQRRVVSSEPSEDEAIRLSDNVVLLRGRERSVATYYGGLPRVGDSRWSAVWVREEDGVWRLTAETSTHVKASESLAFVPAPQSQATLDALAGRWTLALQPTLDLVLTVENGKLIGTVPGQQAARFVFSPASATHFFAEDRPFELRFAADGKSLSLVTWGTATEASRALE